MTARGGEKELPAPLGFCGRHSIPPRAHKLRITNKKGIQMLSNQKRWWWWGQMSTTAWPERSQEGWLCDLRNRWMAWMAVPFMETENPGGEAGLGYRGRTEISVRHDEFETWGRSYLAHDFPWLLGVWGGGRLGEKQSPSDSQDSENLASESCTRCVSQRSLSCLMYSSHTRL